MPQSSCVTCPRFTLPIKVHNLHLSLGNSQSMEKVSLLNICSTYEQGGRRLVREEIQEERGGRNVLGKVTHQLPKCPLVRKISKHCDLHLRAGIWVIPQWFWHSSLLSVIRSPGLWLQLKDSHSRSHHKDHGWPQVLCCNFLLISLELAAVPREQRGVIGRGEEETQPQCPWGSWMVSASLIHQPLLLWTSEPVHLVSAPSLLYS